MISNIEQMICTAARFSNTTVAELARTIGMAPSNFYRKIKHDTFKQEELSRIAEVLGGEYCFFISFPNGSKIGKLDKPVFMRKTKNVKSDTNIA